MATLDDLLSLSGTIPAYALDVDGPDPDTDLPALDGEDGEAGGVLFDPDAEDL